MKRHATAVWNGMGKYGNGYLTTESTVLSDTKFSFNSRFADERGTNPEELLAAAHAGCFTMKLSFVLAEAGFIPGALETTAYIIFENGYVSGSQLFVKAKLPGITRELFEACIEEAKLNCPLCRVLNAKITVETVSEN